jgi:Spy/CpxP family protein refolding chaperone
MFKHFSQALGVVVVLGSAPAFAGSQQPDLQPVQSVSEPMLRPSLLQDPKLRQDIGITDQQSLAIEQIFSTSIQSLRAARKELDEHEALLSRTLQQDTADLLTVSQEIDKVEAARAPYNKARTLLLFRMNLVLTPEQRQKVKPTND